MEPPHIDSKRWTGDPEVDQLDYDRARARPRSTPLGFGPKRDLQLPGKIYIMLLLSILLPMASIWLVEGSTVLISPPVAKFQLSLWLGLVLVAGVAGLARRGRLQLSIATMGIAVIFVSSALNLVLGIAAWCLATGDPPSRAVIVDLSYSRNNTTATMVLADGFVARMQWQSYRPKIDECVITRKWSGPAGYSLIQVLGPAVSPATGEPLMTEDPRLCFAGHRATRSSAAASPPGQLGSLVLLVMMIAGAGLLYLFLVRTAGRADDRSAQ